MSSTSRDSDDSYVPRKKSRPDSDDSYVPHKKSRPKRCVKKKEREVCKKKSNKKKSPEEDRGSFDLSLPSCSGLSSFSPKKKTRRKKNNPLYEISSSDPDYDSDCLLEVRPKLPPYDRRSCSREERQQRWIIIADANRKLLEKTMPCFDSFNDSPVLQSFRKKKSDPEFRRSLKCSKNKARAIKVFSDDEEKKTSYPFNKAYDDHYRKIFSSIYTHECDKELRDWLQEKPKRKLKPKYKGGPLADEDLLPIDYKKLFDSDSEHLSQSNSCVKEEIKRKSSAKAKTLKKESKSSVNKKPCIKNLKSAAKKRPLVKKRKSRFKDSDEERERDYFPEDSDDNVNSLISDPTLACKFARSAKKINKWINDTRAVASTSSASIDPCSKSRICIKNPKSAAKKQPLVEKQKSRLKESHEERDSFPEARSDSDNINSLSSDHALALEIARSEERYNEWFNNTRAVASTSSADQEPCSKSGICINNQESAAKKQPLGKRRKSRLEESHEERGSFPEADVFSDDINSLSSDHALALEIARSEKRNNEWFNDTRAVASTSSANQEPCSKIPKSFHEAYSVDGVTKLSNSLGADHALALQMQMTCSDEELGKLLNDGRAEFPGDDFLFPVAKFSNSEHASESDICIEETSQMASVKKSTTYVKKKCLPVKQKFTAKKQSLAKKYKSKKRATSLECKESDTLLSQSVAVRKSNFLLETDSVEPRIQENVTISSNRMLVPRKSQQSTESSKNQNNATNSKNELEDQVLKVFLPKLPIGSSSCASENKNNCAMGTGKNHDNFKAKKIKIRLLSHEQIINGKIPRVSLMKIPFHLPYFKMLSRLKQ